MARSANKLILCALILLSLSSVSLQVDDEYCSLNLTQDECIAQTKNRDCCWLEFNHQNGYGRPISGCFDYRFMVNSIKFITNPKGFDTMTDSEVCSKLDYQCTSVTKENFLEFFSKVPPKAAITKITAITSAKCHN